MGLDLLLGCFLEVVFADEVGLVLGNEKIGHAIYTEMMGVCCGVLEFFV